MLNLVRASIFRLIQILWLPVGAIGYVLFVVQLIMYSRRTGTSATVLASFYTRYMQHKLGTRRDEPCERLMRVLPTARHLGWRLGTAPPLAAHSLPGYVPRIYRSPSPGAPPMRHQGSSRTTFYDDALERYLPDVDQLVILGAGFDTRAYRLP